MPHQALEAYVDALIAEHSLAPVEPREPLRDALKISRMTQMRKEKKARLQPVAMFKNCKAFATREYLLGCLAIDESEEKAA